ncbi:hypothetical protein KNT64_gp159 [Pseudomonas phage PspYZU05]|uniref:Uncharacterized protein n=1 Tax=Pseudomonas phage PspYZU05 TaxID=1983556 RepID=A0A2U7NF60_9CAUD|nr:hypothetical protein KNT64_gp159 [Pseudomonas phage PspYZU05]ASD52111.1 hypothetical protein PspYZU05_159 [Pseudomonas phage PspYZU05]
MKEKKQNQKPKKEDKRDLSGLVPYLVNAKDIPQKFVI